MGCSTINAYEPQIFLIKAKKFISATPFLLHCLFWSFEPTSNLLSWSKLASLCQQPL